MSAAIAADDRVEGTEPEDIRPVVATGGTGRWQIWAFAAALLVGGLWLFDTLSDARRAAEAPGGLVVTGPEAGRITSPDPLALPDRFAGLEREAPRRLMPEVRDNLPAMQPAPARNVPAAPSYQPPQYYPPPRGELPPAPTYVPPPETSVVFEGDGSAASATDSGERVKAGRLARPGFTVMQGTVIPAVLETALDSTQRGGVRALVQRDVKGFDGSRVLIPRGSRLYGRYEADLQRGQKRALVQWTRLVRPDGVTVALDSPASDPLGRAGIKGKVDGKFWQRFGNAILQSVLDIGVGVATSRASDGVVVALPGSVQNIQGEQRNDIRPTLKVKQGSSVSVFVARDLDFSGVDS